MATPFSPPIAKVVRIGLIVLAAGMGWWMLQPPTAAVAPTARPLAPTPSGEAAAPRGVAPGPRPTLQLPNPKPPTREGEGEPAPAPDDAGLGDETRERALPETEDPISGLVQERGTRLFSCLSAEPPYGIESFRVDLRMVPITQDERIFYDADLTIDFIDDTLPPPPSALLESTLDCLEEELSTWSLPASEEAQESHILFGGPTSSVAPEE